MNAKTTSTANTKTTPFCKVCMDAGKSPEIYKSHYVKNDTGNVICPTLLALECRFCFKVGHTVKYCQTLEKKKKMDAKLINRSGAPKKVDIIPQPISQVSKNPFDCLYSDDDASVTEHNVTTESLDSVYITINENTENGTKTWASIAAQEAPQKMPEPKPVNNFVSVKEIITDTTPKEKIFTFGNYRMKNWADWTDSDEE